MKLSQAVQNAISSMQMEGFKYTAAELEMWRRIATGDLSLDVARAEAACFDLAMRELYPDKFK